MSLASALDPVLGWLLLLPSWLALIIFAAFMALLFSLAQKFLTDQDRMRSLKADLKKGQAEMKKHRDDPKKMMKVQGKLMEHNKELMMMSLKPTLYLLIPLVILFSWMNVNYAYETVQPGEELVLSAVMREPARITLQADSLTVKGEATRETIEKQASWVVSGPEGRHTVRFETESGASAEHEVVIGERPEGLFSLLVYSEPGDGDKAQSAPFVRTEAQYGKLTPLGDFNIFGYHPGWLMYYAVLTIILGIGVRKLLKIA